LAVIKIKCIAGSDILLHFDIHRINDIRQTTLEFLLFQEFNPDARIEKNDTCVYSIGCGGFINGICFL